MAKTPGVCLNTTDCPVGRRRRPIMVALTDPFICPSCGGPLRPPEVKDPPRPPLLVAGAGAGVLLILAAVFFWPGSSKGPSQQAQPPAAKPAPTAPTPASPATPLPAAVNTSPSTGSSSPAGPTTVTLTPPQADDDAKEAPGAAATAAPPKVEETAPLTPTAPKVDTKPPVGVSDATMQANPPPPPSEIEPAPAPRPHHKVVASPRVSSNRTVARPGPDMQALDGSQPEYPASYEDSNRTGMVVATCIVQLNGQATNCRVVQQSGGAAFATAVLDWLARDTTRFRPLLKHGKPAAGPFTWSVSFAPS